MTRIRLIIYIEDPEEAFSVNHIYIKEDTKIEETTMADITTTSHPVKSNAICHKVRYRVHQHSMIRLGM